MKTLQINLLTFLLKVFRFFERKAFFRKQKLIHSETDGQYRPDILLVVGPHRSGTSFFTQILSILGYDLGKSLMLPSYDNPRGFWENEEIVRLHEELLQSFKKDWTTAGFIPEDWAKSTAATKTITKITEVLNDDFKSNDPILVKDPRLCILSPLWQTIADRRNQNLKTIIIIRSPDAIAASISRRNGIEFNEALLIAISYLDAIANNLPDSNPTIFVYEKLVQLQGGELLDVLGEREVLSDLFHYPNLVHQFNQIIKSDKVKRNKGITPIQVAYQELIIGKSPTIEKQEFCKFVDKIKAFESIAEQYKSAENVASFEPDIDEYITLSKKRWDIILEENESIVSLKENIDLLSGTKFQLDKILSTLLINSKNNTIHNSEEVIETSNLTAQVDDKRIDEH